MKYWIKIIILFLLISHNLISAPGILLNKTGLDINTVQQDEVIKDQSVIIRNTGDQTLKFSFQSTCDCLTISSPKSELDAGESVKLNITLDTKDYSHKIKKSFYIISNDPGQKTLLFTLKGYIQTQVKTDQNNIRENHLSYTNEIYFYYFYAPDCNECIKIKNNLFKTLGKKYSVKLTPFLLDIYEKNNMEKLIAVRKQLNKNTDNKIPVLIFEEQYISGFETIYKHLPELIKSNLHKKIELMEINIQGKPVITLSIIPIIATGLVDGINPCAFATIIFLISYLNFIRKSKKIIFITGVFYTGAVFFTYFIIGLGFLKGLTSLPAFQRLSVFIYFIVALFTLYLAILSLKDYFLARQGNYKDMHLQLPASFKRHIHKNIRQQSKGKSIIISAVIMGFVISLFELACTGQFYLPAVIYLTNIRDITGYYYLFIYNLMFILPLVIIFMVFYFGITSDKIMLLFQKNIAAIKLLSFILFLLLSVLLILIKLL